MPFYYQIKWDTDEGQRTAQNLINLRKALAKNIPPQSADNLLLATWNIREFDSAAYGRRMTEAMYYIAEIISCFDLVAVQEVRRDLRALNELMEILGGWWKFVATDSTEGDRGNDERLAFLYDSRRVRFGGVAGELVIPPIKVGDKLYEPAKQLARTPFLVSFKSGWFRFMLATVHILYGSSAAESPERIEEINAFAQFLASRAEESTSWSRNIIMLGDFNIFKPTDKTMQAITDAGFVIPEPLQKVPPSNVGSKKRFYDQIAFRVLDRQLGFNSAGVFDYYKTVYRLADEAEYADRMGKTYAKKPDAAKKTTYYKTYWRTYQMSDHLPMWVELKVDFTDEYLKSKLTS